MKERDAFIDYARTIGIFLVVLGHILLRNEGLKNFIYAFHMPLFFIISGYLYKETQPLWKFLKKNAKSLLLPYAIFYMMTYAIWLFASFPQHPERYQRTLEDGLVKPLVGLFVGVGYSTPFSIMVSDSLWFLIGLFFARLYFYAVLRLTKGNLVAVGGVQALVIGAVWLLARSGYILLFSLESALMALPYFALGYVSKRIGIAEKTKKITSIFALPICLALTVLISTMNGRVDINGFSYGKNILFFYICGAAGSGAVFAIGLLLRNVKSRIISFFGQNTLIILAIHEILTSMTYKTLSLITRKPSPPDYATTDALLISAIVMIGSVVPILIIRKYLPWMVGGRPALAVLNTDAGAPHTVRD